MAFEVGLQACLVRFLCAVKRDKGRQSADDSSKEGGGGGMMQHHCASQGPVPTVSVYCPSEYRYVVLRSVKDVLEH